MTKKLFLSYAFNDRNIVDEIENELRISGETGKQSIEIIDHFKDLKPGENIRESIQKKMESASIIIFVDTENTKTSSWVLYEAGLAYALGKPILIINSRGPSKNSILDNLFDASSFDYRRIKYNASEIIKEINK
jgi:nucleoside 2-deoxyribosyltransferase